MKAAHREAAVPQKVILLLQSHAVILLPRDREAAGLHRTIHRLPARFVQVPREAGAVRPLA